MARPLRLELPGAVYHVTRPKSSVSMKPSNCRPTGANPMNRHDLEQKLPTMTQDQLIDTVKTCLDMIERLEEDLKAGSTKLEELTALVRKLSDTKFMG
jgi:hypothetical protein